MSQCQFTKHYSGSIPEAIEQIKKLIKDSHGTFDGNTNTGAYNIPTPIGNILGTYQVNDTTLDIQISEKPFIIPCSLIEREIDKHLNNDEVLDYDTNLKMYFVKGDSKSYGPFTFDELNNNSVSNEVKIWHLGIRDWINANEIFNISNTAISTTDGEMYWGDGWGNPGIFPENCIGSTGLRKWSARLWNIQGSWEEACARSTEIINNKTYAPRCINKGAFGMWGEFEVEDTSCGYLPPGNGKEIKQCSLFDISFTNTIHNQQYGLKLTFNLLRTPQSQTMAGCLCDTVLEHIPLYVRITAMENNTVASGKWYFKNVQGSNEFPFNRQPQIECVFIPLNKNLKQIFYANFLAKGPLGQTEMVVAGNGPYKIHNGGIEVPFNK